MTSFTIALSSCALFKLEKGAMVYPTGVAFPFVKALELVNQRLDKLDQASTERFKIVLITNNEDMSRLNDSIKQRYLNIDQICEITTKKSLCDHLNDLKPVLYLSTDPKNVKQAIKAGYGAATMFQRDSSSELSCDMLRVAFDGDAVLFSDESESVFTKKGLKDFLENEKILEGRPLTPGPLREFAQALFIIQQKFPEKSSQIHTYLVTSRGTGSSGIRALKTLQEHKLGIDEAFLLCGANKGPVLKTINPHIFFDDQKRHVKSALDNNVVGAHVPFGVANELSNDLSLSN